MFEGSEDLQPSQRSDYYDNVDVNEVELDQEALEKIKGSAAHNRLDQEKMMSPDHVTSRRRKKINQVNSGNFKNRMDEK